MPADATGPPFVEKGLDSKIVKTDALPEQNHGLPPDPQEARRHRRLQTWPMGGWVRPGVPARMQRVDQGQDFEIPHGWFICAPGDGYCVRHLSDRPFPNGFGNPYAVVYISTGRFAGRLWYLGHANSQVVPVGHHFRTGDRLAQLNNSLNAGWGWVEVGWAPNGVPGRFGNGALFHHLFSPVKRWSK